MREEGYFAQCSVADTSLFDAELSLTQTRQRTAFWCNPIKLWEVAGNNKTPERGAPLGELNHFPFVHLTFSLVIWSRICRVLGFSS